MPLTLPEYFDLIGDKYVANFLYGTAILLHLWNREKALKKNLDRPDQKVEFGFFEKGSAIHHTGADWPGIDSRGVFNSLCHGCGFDQHAWTRMPMFNIDQFRDFAEENSSTYVYRLIDEYAGTDDGRYRPLSDTLKGRQLIAVGARELAKIFLENYLCKEYFRLESKQTGMGGYAKSASQKVVIPDAVLRETGRRNLTALLMLTT